MRKVRSFLEIETPPSRGLMSTFCSSNLSCTSSSDCGCIATSQRVLILVDRKWVARLWSSRISLLAKGCRSKNNPGCVGSRDIQPNFQTTVFECSEGSEIRKWGNFPDFRLPNLSKLGALERFLGIGCGFRDNYNSASIKLLSLLCLIQTLIKVLPIPSKLFMMPR